MTYCDCEGIETEPNFRIRGGPINPRTFKLATDLEDEKDREVVTREIVRSLVSR